MPVKETRKMARYVLKPVIGVWRFLSAKYRRNWGVSPRMRLTPSRSIRSRSFFLGNMARLSVRPGTRIIRHVDVATMSMVIKSIVI